MQKDNRKTVKRRQNGSRERRDNFEDRKKRSREKEDEGTEERSRRHRHHEKKPKESNKKSRKEIEWRSGSKKNYGKESDRSTRHSKRKSRRDLEKDAEERHDRYRSKHRGNRDTSKKDGGGKGSELVIDLVSDGELSDTEPMDCSENKVDVTDKRNSWQQVKEAKESSQKTSDAEVDVEEYERDSDLEEGELSGDSTNSDTVLTDTDDLEFSDNDLDLSNSDPGVHDHLDREEQKQEGGCCVHFIHKVTALYRHDQNRCIPRSYISPSH